VPSPRPQNAGMLPTARAGLVVLLGCAAACATGGVGSGTGESGDAGGGQVDSGHATGNDSGGSPYDAGTSPPVDAAPQDSGSPADTGGVTPDDSGACSLTGTSLCANGAACCFMSGVVSCDCQGARRRRAQRAAPPWPAPRATCAAYRAG
jgi:hypothetical protein